MSATKSSFRAATRVQATVAFAGVLALLAACAASAPDHPGTAAQPAERADTASKTPASSPSDEGNGGDPADGRFPIVAYQGADLLGAEKLDFTDVLGRGTPVALNLWAGQCPPCRAEMPAFQRVYDRHAEDFLLLGVDIGPFIGLGSHDDARALLAELDITYPAAYAVDDRAIRDLNVVSMPTTIFYAADGTEHSRHNGLMTEQQFAEAVEQLIEAAP